MNMFYIIFAVVGVYVLLVFFVSRLVVPFMEFGGFKPATKIPEEIKAAITDLELRAGDQQTYLEAVFELVMEKNSFQWKHSRFKAATRLPRAFIKDLSEIWETKDFIYCTAINYLTAALLVNSKYFNPGDIRVRHVFANLICHQYLQVKMGNGWVDVDPAGTGIRGKGIGTHLSFFG